MIYKLEYQWKNYSDHLENRKFYFKTENVIGINSTDEAPAKFVISIYLDSGTIYNAYYKNKEERNDVLEDLLEKCFNEV